MPTVTVYANRAGVVKSNLPYSSFPSSGFNVYIVYRGATTKAHEAGIFGFSVPKNLYGKQVTSGFVTFTKDTITHVFGCVVPEESPEGLSVGSATWVNTIAGCQLVPSVDPVSKTQQQSHASPTAIACVLNGLRIYVDEIYHSGKTQYATIQSAPSVTFTYKDSVVPIIAQEPKNGYCNPKKDITLSCSLDRDIIGPVTVTAAKLRWRKAGQSGYTESAINKGAYFSRYQDYTGCGIFWRPVIPPNILPAGQSIEWQLQLQVNGQWWSQNTAWSTLSTVDSISSASPLSPVNAMIGVNAANIFEWQHIVPTGSDPTGYDLQYSTNNSTWLALAGRKNTAAVSCTIAANALPAGKLWWRVRTYNGDGIAGPWSRAAEIVGYGAPPAPAITGITGTARPTVKWESAAQIAYELVITRGNTEVVRTGESAGTDKSYTVPDFLPNGSYRVSLRIKNSGFYWSGWTRKDFAVNPARPAPAAARAEPVKNGVKVTASGGTALRYLLRDGVPIGKFSGDVFTDYGTAGLHQYVVRSVDTTSGGYADSLLVEGESRIEQAVIAPADALENMTGPLYQAESNVYPSSAGTGAELLYYAGRRYPVAVLDGSISEEFSPAFASLTPAQWKHLREMMESGETVLYRNSAGDCAYCIISALKPQKSWNGFTQWETTLARVDYVERVEYD